MEECAVARIRGRICVLTDRADLPKSSPHPTQNIQPIRQNLDQTREDLHQTRENQDLTGKYVHSILQNLDPTRMGPSTNDVRR